MPLPNNETKAQIGERDIDEVSELSERPSIPSSASNSNSDSDSDFGISDSDCTENDLEHTEYSVTPLIRSSISISKGSAKEMIRALKNAKLEASQPYFVTKPQAKVTSEAGRVVTFEAVTAGQKPIGKWFSSLK